jgi:diguanylate cyclase (GGDEF)-like protein
MSDKLRQVTYMTVKNLKNEDIILPGKYSTTFETFAKGLELDVKDENVVLKELSNDTNYVNNIVKKTNKNLDNFYKTTTDAQIAIKNNDSNSLEKINLEIAQMRREINALQKQLFSDPLTGAYNRKWFTDEYLNDDIFQHDGFIAFLDLNKFKRINDTYGHIVGDQVLKYLVRFLKKELQTPGVDIVRYAGDEFIVLFNKEKTTVLNVDRTIFEAQEKLSHQKLKSAKIDELQFSFSFGISPFKKGDYAEVILNTVDELMYKNKEASREN